MPHGLTAVPLAPEQVLAAFPLVRAVNAGVTEERWRGYARAVCARIDEGGGGIVALQNRRGYIHALFAFTIRDDLIHGRTLETDHVAVIQVGRLEPVLELVLAALDSLARERGCSATHVLLGQSLTPDSTAGRGMISGLRAAGFQAESVRWCKPVLAMNPQARPSKPLAHKSSDA